jgi:hypothetical protein
VHGPTSPLHTFCGLYRQITGQKSNFCTEEARRPAIREMGPAILCCLWLCQNSNEHSHSTSNAPLHAGLPDPNQPDQHSPPPVGGQSRPQPLSTLDGSPTKTECTLKQKMPSETTQTDCTLHRNTRYYQYPTSCDTSVHSRLHCTAGQSVISLDNSISHKLSEKKEREKTPSAKLAKQVILKKIFFQIGESEGNRRNIVIFWVIHPLFYLIL